MKEQVKIIAHAVDCGTDHDTAVWVVSLETTLSRRWNDGSYWQGWIEAEIAYALGVDWMDVRGRYNVCKIPNTDLYAAALTQEKEGS